MPRKAQAKRRPRRAYRGRPASRATATRVLATGVGAVPSRAFGGRPGYSLACWDAKQLAHLALPRAVGPYTPIRVTRRVTFNAHAGIIGTYQEGPNQASSTHGKHEWTEVAMVHSVNSTLPINAPANARAVTVALDGLGEAATLVPSALSVQIMCPTNLQSANGIVYAGVMNTQAEIGGRTETWNSYMEKFVQFQSPRLLAASKLALRGVQINSYPLNMAEVSKFTPLARELDTNFDYNEYNYFPTGWAPIAIYNPSGAELELLITIEYRVRFDLDHPASAGHTHHPIVPDGVWDKLVRQAVSLGNGVMDIADVVANTGMSVGRAMAVGKQLRRAAGTLALTA